MHQVNVAWWRSGMERVDMPGISSTEARSSNKAGCLLFEAYTSPFHVFPGNTVTWAVTALSGDHNRVRVCLARVPLGFGHSRGHGESRGEQSASMLPSSPESPVPLKDVFPTRGRPLVLRLSSRRGGDCLHGLLHAAKINRGQDDSVLFRFFFSTLLREQGRVHSMW